MILIIYDGRMPSKYRMYLEQHYNEALLLPLFPQKIKVYNSISSHPDIYFFQMAHNVLVHAPGVDEILLEKIGSSGIKLIRGERPPSGKYPATARFNAVRVGNNVFLNMKHSDKILIECVVQTGLKVVNVSQGYTRCSVLPVSDKAMMTTDRVIASKAREEGLDVLEVSPREIMLNGQDHGFIGGSGGLSPDNRVVLLGDPSLHEQGTDIKNFIEKHSPGHVTAKGLPLYDAGSLIFLHNSDPSERTTDKERPCKFCM